MAKIRAKTKDWLAVSITMRRKSTNRKGRRRGEGFRRQRCTDAATLGGGKVAKGGQEEWDVCENGKEKKAGKEEK